MAFLLSRTTDFDNPSRSPRDRTRREDRHLNFYELWDNLRSGPRSTDEPTDVSSKNKP
jgi:hypothetical protein